MQNRFVDTATSRAWYASNTLARKLFLTVAILPLSISGTRADVKFIPHAEAGYEYNSNLFQVNEATPRVDPLGMPRLEDTSINYGGGVDLVGAWGENKLKINTAIVRSVYDHFNQLNRNDQLFGLGLDWTATSKIAGTLTARYDQHLTPFTDLADPTIAAVTFSQIDRVFGLAANYQLTSKWLAAVEAGYSRKTVPWNGPSRSYDLQQIPRKIGIKYGGTGRLALGVSIDSTDGMYIHADNAPGFHTSRYQGTLDYTFSPRTTLGANIGHAEYSQRALNSSANVGGVTFNQQLTGKTSYFLQYARTLDVYPTTQGSQLGTTTSGGITWRALRKAGLAVSYAQTKGEVRGNLALPGVIADTHKDTFRSYQATLNYDMLAWLTIAPYYRYQERTSDQPLYEFNNHIYGVTLSVRSR